jgi:enoyl-CoA hydratase
MIDFEIRDHLALVRLNRPDKLNALSKEMMLELVRIFAVINSDEKIRAVILTGAGERAFSAGTDIDGLADLDEAGAIEASRRGQEVCDAIEQCRVPVIAAVRGIAAGGGCEIAIACHLRVAADDARFSLPEVKIGMIPAYGGTQRLARLLGEGRALEMMLTGKSIDAPEALRLGLVNRLSTPSELMNEAESLASEIASLAPLAIRACLEAVRRGLALPLEEGLELEAELFSKLFATEDVREGTRAFLEKRRAVFQGR